MSRMRLQLPFRRNIWRHDFERNGLCDMKRLHLRQLYFYVLTQGQHKAAREEGNIRVVVRAADIKTTRTKRVLQVVE